MISRRFAVFRPSDSVFSTPIFPIDSGSNHRRFYVIGLFASEGPFDFLQDSGDAIRFLAMISR
jgi:hypothetical protein